MESRKLILYIAMSLDGFIATADGDLDFLSVVAQEGEDYGYHSFIASVDAIILGRKTYDKVLSMGHPYEYPDKEVYVITRTPRPAMGTTQFYAGSLRELVQALKSKAGKNIFCDGGAEVVNLLRKESLIDEIIVSVIPVLLGNGIRLFREENALQKLTLLSAKAFDSGLVQLRYACG